jgi:hypothetical protein
MQEGNQWEDIQQGLCGAAGSGQDMDGASLPVTARAGKLRWAHAAARVSMAAWPHHSLELCLAATLHGWPPCLPSLRVHAPSKSSSVDDSWGKVAAADSPEEQESKTLQTQPMQQGSHTQMYCGVCQDKLELNPALLLPVSPAAACRLSLTTESSVYTEGCHLQSRR